MDEVQDLKGGPEMSPTSSFVSATPSKGPLRLIIKIVVGVVVILMVGIGVALGTRIWDPLWNPFRPEPEEVMEKMATKMKELKTIHSEVKIEFKMIDEKLKQGMQISVSLNSDSDVTDPKNSKEAVNFSFEMTNLKAENLLLGGENRITGDTSYLKLDTIEISSEFVPLLMMFGIDLSKIQGQWIKLDKEVLESLTGRASGPEVSEEEQEKLREKLLRLFKEKKVYYVKEELPDQKIEGKKAYHYVLALDREKIKEVIPELFKITTESSKEEIPVGEFGTAFMAGGIAESIDRFLEKIGGIDIEVWIGKKDGLLYKAKLEKEIDASKIEKGAKGKMIIKVNVEFSNFNEPTTIEAPKDFIEAKDLIPVTPSPFFPTTSSYPDSYQPNFPYNQPIMQKDSPYLLQASLLRVLLGL